MSIWHWRLFFWSDKVSCLIVVFLVLVALTPCRPSSLCLPVSSGTAVRRNQHGRAFEVNDVLFDIYMYIYYLLYSRRAEVPLPTHQTATIARQQQRTGKGRSLFSLSAYYRATLDSGLTRALCPPTHQPL